MFSSPKSQHEVRIIGTGIRHGGLTKMWGSAVSPGRDGGGGMIHKFLTTLSLFMLRFSDSICFGYFL
jgi:hypothetical protein